MIRSILRGWRWIGGAAVFALLVIAVSWFSVPRLFRTSAEIRVLSPSDPRLWEDAQALKGRIAADGQRIIAVTMGGQVKNAVGRSKVAAEQFGIDVATEQGRDQWSEVWDRQVTMAGPVDGEIFLIVDDEDGDRGAALAGAVLEALEVEWRRRADEFNLQSIDRLDRSISKDMAALERLTEECTNLSEGVEEAQTLVLLAERDAVARQVAESRIRRNRFESSCVGQPLPWMVVKKPSPYEYHLRKVPDMPVLLSALAVVFLVGVGWVVFDPRNP